MMIVTVLRIIPMESVSMFVLRFWQLPMNKTLLLVAKRVERKMQDIGELKS